MANQLPLESLINQTIEAIKKNNQSFVDVEFDLFIGADTEGKLNVYPQCLKEVTECSKIRFKITTPEID